MIITEARYLQIAAELECALPGMLLSGSSRLPSEAELCEKFSCSRQTVRAALAELQNRRLIIKCRGSGSFISESAARGNTIALILPRKYEYIYPVMVSTVERYFSGFGFRVSSYSSGHSVFTEREILKALVQDPPAGIIIEAAGLEEFCICADVLRQLEGMKIPVVYLNAAYSLPAQAERILQDDRAAAYRLTDTLLHRGCKTILCLMRENNAQSAGRFAGCAMACLDNEAPFSERQVLWLSDAKYENILNGEYTELGAFLHEYIGREAALVCCSDELAYHAINALGHMGCTVPEELSVAGFDNSYYAAQGEPNISTVDMGADKLAQKAAETMFLLLTGRKAEKYELPADIILRGSTK